MQNNLTKSTARDLAHKLMAARELLAKGTLSGMYEAIAQMCNHRNWDTMSAALEDRTKRVEFRLKEYKNTLPLAASVDVGDGLLLGMDMRAPDDNASPDWAFLEINQGLMDRLTQAREQVIVNEFKRVTLESWPESFATDFFPESDDDGHFNMQNIEIVVDAASFQLRATPKHTTYQCTSQWTYFSDLDAALAARKKGETGANGLDWLTDRLLLSVRDMYGEMGDGVKQSIQEAVLPDGGKLSDEELDIWFSSATLRSELEKIFVYE